jgi:hypothetical protein
MVFKHHLPFASSPARPLDKIGLIKEAVASFLPSPLWTSKRSGHNG